MGTSLRESRSSCCLRKERRAERNLVAEFGNAFGNEKHLQSEPAQSIIGILERKNKAFFFFLFSYRLPALLSNQNHYLLVNYHL